MSVHRPDPDVAPARTMSAGHPPDPVGAPAHEVRVAGLTDIAPATLYGLLRLRVDVFVVEQNCPYPELDGRDTEPGTRHLWIAAGSGEPVAYLRILEDPDEVARIGRVVVAERARGDGHAGRLLRTALSLVGDRVCVLGAQAHLEGFYERFGFVRNGPGYVEDGIPHVPMRRPPSAR